MSVNTTDPLTIKDPQALRNVADRLSTDVWRLKQVAEAVLYYSPPEGVDSEYAREALNAVGRSQVEVLYNLALDALEWANVATYTTLAGEVRTGGEGALDHLNTAAALCLALQHEDFPHQLGVGQYRCVCNADVLYRVRREVRSAWEAVKHLQADAPEDVQATKAPA